MNPEVHGLRQILNPPNPYSKYTLEWLDIPEPPKLQVFEEAAKSILSKNDSPDVGFTYSVNPYRGCFHGCTYCYARPSHQYLDFGAGTDFERKIVVKINAPEQLEAAFLKPSWRGELVAFSGNTDCYQPLEGSYELTRRLLQVCDKFRNPVTLITKGALIRRDIDVLKSLAEKTYVHVWVSLAFSDDKMSRLIEPYAPSPSTRFRVIEELTSNGISTGIGVAPIIAGLNDVQIPEILQRAAAAGAKKAFRTLLRLPAETKDIFLQSLEEHYPTRMKKVLSSLTAMKGGKLNRTEFGKRMVGEGARWEALEWLFDSTCEKLGLNSSEESVPPQEARMNSFRRPVAQLELF